MLSQLKHPSRYSQRHNFRTVRVHQSVCHTHLRQAVLQILATMHTVCLNRFQLRTQIPRTLHTFPRIRLAITNITILPLRPSHPVLRRLRRTIIIVTISPLVSFIPLDSLRTHLLVDPLHLSIQVSLVQRTATLPLLPFAMLLAHTLISLTPIPRICCSVP